MPKKADAGAPDLASLAAELALLRKRVATLERAEAARRLQPGAAPAAVPKALPGKRNSPLADDRLRTRIEPSEPWNLGPPGASGKRRP